MVVVAGYMRVPRPAAVITAFCTLLTFASSFSWNPSLSRIGWARALGLSTNDLPRAEHDGSRRTPDKRTGSRSCLALICGTDLPKRAVHIRGIGGGEDRYSPAGSAARDLRAIQALIRAALPDQVYQEVCLFGTQVEPVAVRGVRFIHQPPGFDEEVTIGRWRLRIRRALRGLLMAETGDLHQAEELLYPVVLQDGVFGAGAGMVSLRHIHTGHDIRQEPILIRILLPRQRGGDQITVDRKSTRRHLAEIVLQQLSSALQLDDLQPHKRADARSGVGGAADRVFDVRVQAEKTPAGRDP